MPERTAPAIRLFSAFLLLMTCCLHAQLDPRLQACKTDFLDLYQQSSSTIKPKPEVVTIFDFSDSMAALMYHPLFRNDSIANDDANTTMTFTLSGNRPSVSFGGYGFIALVKPDGTEVTQADAESCKGLKDASGRDIVRPAEIGLYNSSGSSSERDIRHWLLAASHARFSCTSGSGGSAVTRTIDIPIPWKITTAGSAGNPLSSLTIKDEQKKTTLNQKGESVTVTYGSGKYIEFDLNYMVSDGIFAAKGPSAVISASLNGETYKTSYINWLFNGKFQSARPEDANYTTDSSLVGKYIVYDAAATSSSVLAAGQLSADWGRGYGRNMAGHKIRIPNYNEPDGTYSGVSEAEASKYIIPSVTRAQATKKAAITTWIQRQADVLWAFRFLDSSVEANTGNATTIDNNSKTTIIAGNPMTSKFNGVDSGWTVLNNTPSQGINSQSGNSVTGMQRIAAAFTSGSRPLTYAMARSLAQYNDPNSIFNEVLGKDVSQCSVSFLIIFTDGLDNNGGGTNNANDNTPYILNANQGLNATFSAIEGNRAILKNPSSTIDALKTYWNLFTFAAMGAHMANSSFGTHNVDYFEALDPGASTKTGTPSSFLPFAVKKRAGVTFTKPHRITTMTIGVSLGGKYTDAKSPKRSLFLGAVLGDPNSTNGTLSSYHSFMPPTFNADGSIAIGADGTPAYNDWLPDSANPEGYPEIGKKNSGAVCFFDATDPDRLSASLKTAMLSIISANTDGATSNQNLPFVGTSLGKQVYVGNFYTPQYGGVIWTGDLLMFNTVEESVDGKNMVRMIDYKGDIVSGTLNDKLAGWAASEALRRKKWHDRMLYTRLPGARDSAPLKKFTDSGDDFDNSTSGLKNFVGGSNPRATVQFAAGGDTVRGPFDSGGRPTANRTTIMGDIINSAPAAIEYAWENVNAALGNYPRLSAVVGNNRRFRLILVGTNQGWLHAFGEVTTVSAVINSKGESRELITGAVEELWSFMPTDFLRHLDYISYPGNVHRAMADGSPALYHLDIPSPFDGTGNGVIDKGERAVAVFGLGKGGRSYYALNIENPFKPEMQWTLIPDEASSMQVSRIESGSGLSTDSVANMIARWGFSTATPAFGRIVFSGTSGMQLRDAVFLSGGFSSPQVDDKFKDAKGRTTPLGRSIIALDVYTGKVLAAVDLSGDASVGPISAGLIPFEFVVNSGTAQRAYFTDYNGGLWAWGSDEVSYDAPYKFFRKDTSELNKWRVRRVYKDDSIGASYTTPPAPFRVGNFTGSPRPNSGSPRPAAVGIAMVSGDRNNPLDYYGLHDIQPANNKLTVIFDRQDGPAWNSAVGIMNGTITNNALMNFSNSTVAYNPTDYCNDSIFRYVTPGCDTYYLAPRIGDPKFGYYINFPARNGRFIPKGINTPAVVAGSLFYTIFIPAAADPCTGGFGISESWVISDILNPLKEDNRGISMVYSGRTNLWSGVASNYIMLGTRGVIQGGTIEGQTDSAAAMEIRTTATAPSQSYPKPKVWRVVR